MVREVRNIISLELNRLLGLSKLNRFYIMPTLSLMWPLFSGFVRHDLPGSAIRGSSLAHVTTARGAFLKNITERCASTIAFIFSQKDRYVAQCK